MASNICPVCANPFIEWGWRGFKDVKKGWYKAYMHWSGKVKKGNPEFIWCNNKKVIWSPDRRKII